MSILNIRSFRAADHDTDQYLVVAKVRQRLAVSKQAAQKFHVERFNLTKLNELQVRNQYQIKISNRYAALENLSDCKDIKRGWENIKENINILGLYELKQHNPMTNVYIFSIKESMLKCSDYRIQTKAM